MDRKLLFARSFPLSSIISPSRTPNCFKFYITFVNADGCKIHVPVHPNNSSRFKTVPDQLVIGELQRKAKKYIANDLTPEYQPLLLPGSEFFLKVRTARQPLSIPRGLRGIRLAKCSKSNKPNRPVTPPPDPSPPPPTPPKLKVELPPKPIDLYNLETFTRAFIEKRVELSLNQAEVARSLRVLYGFHRTGSLISRVERMDLTLNNMLQVYPVLLRWLQDTEVDEIREAILLSAKGGTVEEELIKRMNEKPLNCDSNLFRKRRDRTKLDTNARKILENAFRKSAHPHKKVIEELASKVGIDKHVVRVWFYNRRQRTKRE